MSVKRVATVGLLLLTPAVALSQAQVAGVFDGLLHLGSELVIGGLLLFGALVVVGILVENRGIRDAELVLLKKCIDAPEASRARAWLEANGILAILQDDGCSLKVSRADARGAARLLQVRPTPDEPPER